ncbi:MAG: outer membrane protein assembly factor BamD, partial [Spirochaetaceae bacterium]|nr:outer membrane protein assembly factor BamD [Spirochaetaceae bacterium]
MKLSPAPWLSLFSMGLIFCQSAPAQKAEEPSPPQFSVMRRIAPEPAPQENPQNQAPQAPPQTQPEAPAQTAPAQTAPAEPPPGIAAAEPVTPAPSARQEALPRPVNPPPETPSRIYSQIEPKRENISTSRTIWALAGQQTEIPFRGNGWVYLGEQENRPGLTYQSRRNEPEGQKYFFQAETPGTYSLKFYRQDFIENYIINDFVQVIVSENPGTGTRTQPREQEQNPKPGTAGTENSAAGTPRPVSSPSSGESPDYLGQAKEAYRAGSFPQAISLLNQFREIYPAGTDEAWWLYAQSLEANSSSRNIRSALEYYRKLIQEYPQSQYSPEAQRRIAYLERYYFN